MSVDVILVVPCFNEEARLDLPAFARALADSDALKLVFVDDGSGDGTAARLCEFAEAHPERVSVCVLETNQGKAEAVRRGVLFAYGRSMIRSGDSFGYWDADLSTPLNALAQFQHLLESRPALDLVLGSRVKLLGRDIERRPLRHYLGRIFATAASVALGVPIYDTQCGAKMFRARTWSEDLWQQPFKSRWLFDVELLFRILEKHEEHESRFEDSTAELPLDRWIHVGGSKVKPADFFVAVWELAMITWHHRRVRARHSQVG